MADVVGWREWVSLPDWGVARLRAKIDTGARTSALHVENLEVLPGGLVSFDVVLDRRESPGTVRVTAAERVRTSTVKPSSGVRQRRHVVETTLKLGAVEKTIEISLVDRGEMLCRMLVGRTALGGDFLVDPEHTYVVSKRKRKRKKRRRRPVKKTRARSQQR
ncbi:MAG: RimK/LysX family protein [Thermoanaerobaculia bacterium]|nr:RimK/LysX family protein [Thermoanaerobaculia bacterium]